MPVDTEKEISKMHRMLHSTQNEIGKTYYRWRQKYGGMAPEVAKQLKALEKENSRLKKVVADQALDIQILKEAARPNL